MATIDDRIKELRTKKGFTQDILAESLMVNRSTLANWEISRAFPDVNTIVKMADLFDVSADYLLGRDDYIQRIAAQKRNLVTAQMDEVLKQSGVVLTEEEQTFLGDLLKSYIETIKNKRKRP